MRRAGRDRGNDYLGELGRVARRARLAVVASRIVPGALVGLAAGFVYLVVRPFLPPGFTLVHPLVVPGLLLAAGVLAGAVVGCAVRIGRARIAVQADRSLGTRGLASASLEVAEGRRASAFADALLEDATTALRAAGPRRIVGRPSLRHLPWTAAAAAAVIAAGLLPFNLRELFPARRPVDRTIVQLGGELEESGRRLEEESLRRDLRQGLVLSRELQQLGKDLQMQEGQAEELARRLAELESRIGQEYELMLRRFQDRQRPPGNGPGDGSGTGEGNAEPMPGTGDDREEGRGREEVERSTLPPEARELAEALELLQQLKERSGSKSGPDGDGKESGSPGERAAEERGSGLPGGGDESTGAEGDPDASPKAGTEAVRDEPGPATEIAKADAGEPLKADSQVGEGEKARMLVRALPEATGASTSEDPALGEYRRQVESALAAEQVPLALREYVKGYFMGLEALDE